MCGKGVVGVEGALGSLSGRPDQSGLNPGSLHGAARSISGGL